MKRLPTKVLRPPTNGELPCHNHFHTESKRCSCLCEHLLSTNNKTKSKNRDKHVSICRDAHCTRQMHHNRTHDTQEYPPIPYLNPFSPASNQPWGPTLDWTLLNLPIFQVDSWGPSSNPFSFACAAAEWPMEDLVGVGFLGFMRCTALSAGSDDMTQSYRKPWETRSPNGVDGLAPGRGRRR